VNPLSAAARAIGRELDRRVREVRAQAPGARMVGEFTVKFGLRRLTRALGLSHPQRDRDPEVPTDGSKDAGPQ
jgi:hypothetical protein